ncbi:sirohydrochlorin cobaltochelatase [Ferrimonas sediminum]|uniref:Sirohydrochlorin cobaltochelatase n=1 Tax=Ferrimonas sediminum TaxID=718193 RepID=A0A1G8WJY4_9GAMM|nr:sirohydrochlorin cobaltochelatase [Ferrimonas sediminum]SDJ78678.1 sirohydrochlorin cobaltochelatase [Ferrimonas sediminum]
MKRLSAALTATVLSTHLAAAPAPIQPEPSAIVLAAFGTTYDSAVDSLLKIQHDVQQAYPDTPVRFAFTSNIIRKRWHQRRDDRDYQVAHPEIPAELYQVKNVLGTLADLQNDGYRDIVVQTTLLTHGEEFTDLLAYTDALSGIDTLKAKWKPFQRITVGRPLMGTWGAQQEYRHDLEALTQALAADVDQARRSNAALVYMGHGNDHLSTGLYYELEELMNQHYPDVPVYVGLVEGHPDFDRLSARLQQDGVTRVQLRPLMVVAGDHASNDMAGDEPDSWKVQLQQLGMEVEPILSGLGNNPQVRQRYLNHLNDAAAAAGIVLK